jgi:primary-amine oxidase
LTWWRVGSNSSLNPDGHRRSYEVVNQNTPNTSIPVTAPLITATNRRDCEEYASKNLNPSCPNLSILDYVEQDDEPLSDPVLWINAGFHHIVRDEDQSPMPIHWQRFQLVPRDFFAQSPSVTDARSCINGPSGDINSTSRPCVATSVSRPRITPTSAAPGTTLTTTNGLWVQNRTTWNYGYMWHRDGEPILDPATSEPETRNTYTVTEADAGHDLTVKVYAHKPGFTTGVATSSAITIPGPPRPSAGPTPTASTTTATPPQPTRSAAPKMRTSRIVAASRKKVASKKSAKLTVTVRSTGGYVPTGRVTVSRKSKAVSARLSRGRVVLRLPKITRRGTYTFTITYHGDSRAKKSTSRVRVQVTRR